MQIHPPTHTHTHTRDSYTRTKHTRTQTFGHPCMHTSATKIILVDRKSVDRVSKPPYRLTVAHIDTQDLFSLSVCLSAMQATPHLHSFQGKTGKKKGQQTSVKKHLPTFHSRWHANKQERLDFQHMASTSQGRAPAQLYRVRASAPPHHPHMNA